MQTGRPIGRPQRFKKSLAEFAAFAANKIKSILRRGVYTTQNTI